MSTQTSNPGRFRPPGGAGRLAVLLLACALFAAVPLALGAQSPNEALFNAVEVNDIDAVEAAIKAGADLAAKNADGMTPADVAVDLGHFRIAHILLSRRTQPPDTKTAPRVTEKVKEALTQPRQRVAAPAPGASSAPVPKLSDLVPPKKPMPAAAAVPPEDAAPAPMPEAAPATPPAGSTQPVKKAPPPPEMRPDDEIARSAPDTGTPAKTAQAPASEGGFLERFWDGVNSVVTLGGLIGGEEEQMVAEQPDRKFGSNGQELLNPADRFSSRPAPPRPESESSAGRMVDRMTGMVGGDAPKENEFGLPEGPVVPLPDNVPGLAAPNLESAEVPGLAEPLAPPGVAVPVEPPGLEQPPGLAQPMEPPGLAEPVLPPGADDQIPGLAAPTLPPGAESIEVPGLPGDLAMPELPDGPAPPDPEQPGLDIPGLAAPTGEIPGIIPPPSQSAGDIPALPPGLEPLPGSDTGQLRRPGGLVEPRDPNVLPPPGDADMQAQLRRYDDLLGRAPEQNAERYLTPRGTSPETGAPRTAPEKAPVSEEPGLDPLMEIPKGLDEPRTAPTRRATPDRASPAEILRRARDSDAVRRERERFEKRLAQQGKTIPKPLRPSGHQLPAPDKPVTAREEPASRMFERFSNLTESPYQDEDVHGLPIVRPSIDGRTPPRKDVRVAEIPRDKAEETDFKLQKLARFFRGDQEEEAGMKAPEYQPPKVEREPLPRVIDNLVPENDPARGRVVDDKMLDLTGVELRAPDDEIQAGASPTRDGRLDENFLDRLTTVLGPAREQQGIPGEAPPEPGTIGLQQLDVPPDQQVKKAKPAIPDPWTMTVERNDPEGQKQTLGVTAISPEDGSEIRTEQGVVSEMVGRIRQLFEGPRGADEGPQVDKLDADDRQAAAEQLLSEALRDGVPTALPDQGQWPVTEVEPSTITPGVPPAPRPGVLTRTSLDDVVLSLGESVTLENTLPPQQDGIDPLNSCVKKNRGTTLFCIEPVDWPQDLRPAFVVPTILYTGPSAITRYDQGSPSRFHALFEAEQFEDVVAYYQARYGEPTEIWKRSIAPLAKPRMDNPTVTWRSRDSRSNVITVLEIRKFDDTRGGFPDTNRGAAMLYHMNAPSIFPQVSSHELMRLRRTR
ncbi:MAG: hypothetical protein JJ900_06575 [Rhodospirillales bacterium]|nr:hypothetical protein [Rhodospirillales bacterium]MBO6786501.1 hypothetical protein [Rhodospirillales bacterium]